MKNATAAFAALIPLAAASAGDPSTLDFARKAEFESARISPNGEYLAVVIPSTKRSTLGILDVKTRTLTASLGFQEGEHVDNYHWVSPTRVVASLARRNGTLDRPRPTGELYATNADGTQKKYLFGYRGDQQVGSHLKRVVREYASADVVNPMPGVPDRALVLIRSWRSTDSAPVSLEWLNVDNGSRTRLPPVPASPPIRVAADREGNPWLASGHDKNNNIHLFVRAKTRSGWKKLKLTDGAIEDVRLLPLSRDAKSAYFITDARNGRNCMKEYRIETGTTNDLLCREGIEIGYVSYAFDGSRPIAVRNADDVTKLEPVPPEHADFKLLKTFTNTFPGERISVSSQSEDGRRLVLFVDSARNPGDYYLFDRGTRKVEYLISRRSWIDPENMAPVAHISYQARDNVTIHGYVTSKQGLDTRKAPLVVLPHGGPHGIRDYWVWDAWPQFLASKGYAVLQPNFRGSGGYGQAFEQAGYRKWGTLMQDDVTDAVQWAIAKGIADPDRICIVGASYGGYAALMSATREPDLYRCAVGFAGVYDLESQQGDSDTSHTLYGRNYLKEVLGPDEEQWAAQSPVNHVAKLKAPVLIAHGTSDKRVPFAQAKLLREALEKHGKPFEWLEYHGEEHGFHHAENHADFLDKLALFLEKHIGSKPQ